MLDRSSIRGGTWIVGVMEGSVASGVAETAMVQVVVDVAAVMVDQNDPSQTASVHHSTTTTNLPIATATTTASEGIPTALHAQTHGAPLEKVPVPVVVPPAAAHHPRTALAAIWSWTTKLFYALPCHSYMPLYRPATTLKPLGFR